MFTWKARLYDQYTSGHVVSQGELLRAQLAARMPYLKRLIKEHFPADRSVRILDLGCGYGALLVALRDAGYKSISGVDVSAQQIEAAGSLGELNLSCRELMAYLRTQENERFDVIAALDVLEHFPREELLALVDEVTRVLRRGGSFIVHVPNGEAIASGAVRYGDLTYELAFTSASLRQLANACGLQAVRFAEDRPATHGIVSAARAVLWWLMTIHFRILRMAETGCGYHAPILSQNLLAILKRPE
ncbi:MAG: class I SAM-dependent methyltransferase [Acidobacteriaceae bacterium]